MMKLCFDAMEDVISLLDVPILNSAITGKVYPFSRPVDSDKIDVVVGLLTLDNEPIQRGIVNIRVHAPSLNIKSGETYSNLPDQALFNTIEGIITPLVNDQFKSSFWTEILTPGTVVKQPDGTWFMLIQLEYNSYNEDFKNI